MENHGRTFQLMMRYVSGSLNKGHTLKKVLALPQWKIFCSDYRRAEEMFHFFETFFPKEVCHLTTAKVFLETCGNHLADWAIHQGDVDSLSLLLHHAHLSRHNLWMVRRTPRCQPDFHPLNQSIYCGKIHHIDVLLKCGYNLEFTEKFYGRLLKVVVRALVISYQQSSCFTKLRFTSNRSRIFLILLVIRTFLYDEDYPEVFKGCDAALRKIWRHSSASFLCKTEFLSVFEPFSVDMDTLERCYRRYSTRVCFATSTGEYQPFSLAHHSRCKVRQVMGRCLSLPNGVESLVIPTELKSYLLYQ